MEVALISLSRRNLQATNEDDGLTWQQLAESSCWYRVKPGRKLEGIFPQLRDYQELSVQAILDDINCGLYTRVAASATTGAGKTVIMMATISLVPEVGEASQFLILLPTPTLVNQTLETVQRIFGNRISVGVEQGNKEALGTEIIVIANRNSLDIPNRIEKFDPGRFRLILCDEAHHASADSWLRILHYFNAGVDVVEATSEKELGPPTHDHMVPLVGVSGTLAREDGRPLEWVFETIVSEIDLQQLLADGIVAKLEMEHYKSEVQDAFEDWKQKQKCLAKEDRMDIDDELEGELKPRTLGVFQTSADFADLVFNAWGKFAQDKKSILIFASRIDGVHEMVRAFERANVQAVGIASKGESAPTTSRDQDIIRRFKAGKISILVNCCKLLEGFDHPKIDCIIIARKTTSRILNTQIIGRGRRVHPGKKACTIVDMFGNVDRWGQEVQPNLQNPIKRQR